MVLPFILNWCASFSRQRDTLGITGTKSFLTQAAAAIYIVLTHIGGVGVWVKLGVVV